LKVDQNQEGEEEMNAGQAATFLVHLKEHGLTYAVVLLVAQQLGLLSEATALLGGMC
jgi:23S rRNA G2069 N7-methylase RlmK/C1962 C5-methylase RlmI